MNYNGLACRAKSHSTGEWVYGFYVYHVNRTICAFGDKISTVDQEHYIVKDGFSDWNMPRDLELILIDINTLCRCLGIKDKHGNYIYEKDMLDAPYNIVSYAADVNESLGMNAGWYLQRDDFESWSELELRDDYEVIGNTIDNPELIK